jgi:outer membrane protein OmpA-like peptidoglycan-associated protein
MALQRSAGNAAVARVLQRTACEYEPGERDTGINRGVLGRDVSLLSATGSGYNAAGNSVVVADFRPESAVVRSSTATELRGTWIDIIERQPSQSFAFLGFSDCVGDEGANARLRADRAHAVAAMFPKAAGRASVIAAAPAGDFLMPANSTPSERALDRSVLIRLPPEELRQTGEVDEYSADAVGFWRSNPNSSVDDLITFVTQRVAALLERNGVFHVDVIKGKAPKDGTLAFFSPKVWKITLDEQKMTSSSQAGLTPATKMHELTVDAVAELSVTCYHEARHAEQTFMAARLTAEEAKGGMSPRDLALQMDIPLDVAAAAVSASHTVLPDTLKAQASAWRTVEHGGRYLPYKMWNDELSLTLKLFNKVIDWDKHKKEKAGFIQLIWEKVLHPYIDKTFRRDLSFRGDALLRDMKADPHHEPVDAEIGRALTKTSSELFLALAKERGGKDLPDSAAVAKMDSDSANLADIEAQLWLMQLETTLLQAQIAADDAYHAYPNEADAYQVGDAVKASIKRQGS